MTEPLCRAVKVNDVEMNHAYDQAYRTVSKFVRLVEEQKNVTYMAKLRFRDPDLSEELGKDSFLYLWLLEIFYHSEEKLLSGVFFEVPKELEKWHQVGQRLGFDPEDVFDWAVIENGHMTGGFTMRVTRSQLKSEIEKEEYDRYIGISSYEPIGEA